VNATPDPVHHLDIRARFHGGDQAEQVGARCKLEDMVDGRVLERRRGHERLRATDHRDDIRAAGLHTSRQVEHGPHVHAEGSDPDHVGQPVSTDLLDGDILHHQVDDAQLIPVLQDRIHALEPDRLTEHELTDRDGLLHAGGADQQDLHGVASLVTGLRTCRHGRRAVRRSSAAGRG